MGFLEKLRFWSPKKGEKQSQANRAVTFFLPLGQGVSRLTDLLSFAKEGFQQNSVVYACIREISEAAAGVPWVLMRSRGGSLEEIDSHPLLDLLGHPNPLQGGFEFIESTMAYLYLAGNSYIEAVGPERGPPRELYNLRPDRMQVLPDRVHLVGGYIYKVNAQEMNFTIDEVRHIKLFNPIDDFYGLSPVQVAALAIDKMNEGDRWNASLLRNMATPSGALVSEQRLDDDQFKRLKSEMREQYQGAMNARAPILLDGGLDWKEMGLNPKDMDFIKGINLSALQIAQIYNMPPELIGLHPATYQNRKEARKALYTETVLPALFRLRDAFNSWLVPKFKDRALFLTINKDGIEALSEDHDSLWKRANESRFLTVNEKRELVGYDQVESGEVILVRSGDVSLEDATTQLDFGNPDESRMSDADLEVKAINTRNPRARQREARTLKRLRRKFERMLGQRVGQLFMAEGNRVADLFLEFGQGRALEEIESRRAIWEDVLADVNRKTLLFFADRTLKQIKSLYGPDEFKADPDQVLTLFEQLSERFARELSADAIKEISGATQAEIQALLEKGISEGQQLDEIADAIREKFDGFSEGRAKTIARTEVHGAQTFAQEESAKRLNVPDLLKVWLWSGVSREEHAAVDGTSVAMEDDFNVGGASMSRPGDPRGGPENVINCACGLAFERG